MHTRTHALQQHVRALLVMVEEGQIVKPPAPQIPDMSLRGFGSFSLGRRTADHHRRTQIRQELWDRYMQQAHDSPEDFSPVVPFEQVGDNLVGRKIKIRWWTEVDGEVNGEEGAQAYLQRSSPTHLHERITQNSGSARTLSQWWSGMKNSI